MFPSHDQVVANALPKEASAAENLFNYSTDGDGASDPIESFSPVSQNDTQNDIKYLVVSKSDVDDRVGTPRNDYSPPGFGLDYFDKENNASYAKEITGAENFEFPNRRDETSTDTNNTSYKGVVRCANSGTDIGSGPGAPGTTGEVSYTHEVFDVANALPKED